MDIILSVDYTVQFIQKFIELQLVHCNFYMVKSFIVKNTNNLFGSDMKNLRHLVQFVSDYFDLISLYKTGAPNAAKDIW